MCPSCTHEEIAEPVCAPLWSAAALCGHRSRSAMICIADMRAPHVADRCNLGSVSVMPQVVACPGRDHYVITRLEPSTAGPLVSLVVSLHGLDASL